MTFWRTESTTRSIVQYCIEVFGLIWISQEQGSTEETSQSTVVPATAMAALDNDWDLPDIPGTFEPTSQKRKRTTSDVGGKQDKQYHQKLTGDETEAMKVCLGTEPTWYFY